MRIALDLNDELLNQARLPTGTEDRSALIQEGLRVLIQRESAHKLSGLSGKQPDLKLGRRRWILLVSELGQEAAGSPTAPCCLLEADCKPSSVPGEDRFTANLLPCL